MRLFIAVPFDEKTKRRLVWEMERMKSFARTGSFTRRDNLHLTVQFLGEVQEKRIEDIKRAMEDASDGLSAMELKLDSFGSFPSGQDRCLYWRGVSKTPELQRLYDRVCRETEKLGFKREKRGYTPHVTLIRNCKMSAVFRERGFAEGLTSISFKSDRLCLMESVRREGVLVYNEIYSVKLK